MEIALEEDAPGLLQVRHFIALSIVSMVSYLFHLAGVS